MEVRKHSFQVESGPTVVVFEVVGRGQDLGVDFYAFVLVQGFLQVFELLAFFTDHQLLGPLRKLKVLSLEVVDLLLQGLNEGLKFLDFNSVH